MRQVKDADAHGGTANDADAHRGTDAYRNAGAYRAAVLRVVASIPRGRVMTYASIADYLAEGWRRRSPRLVGHIMAGCDSRLPWHRVVGAGGRPVRGHEAEALRRLRADGTPLTGLQRDRVEMRQAAWAPDVPPPSPEVPWPEAPSPRPGGSR